MTSWKGTSGFLSLLFLDLACSVFVFHSLPPSLLARLFMILAFGCELKFFIDIFFFCFLYVLLCSSCFPFSLMSLDLHFFYAFPSFFLLLLFFVLFFVHRCRIHLCAHFYCFCFFICIFFLCSLFRYICYRGWRPGKSKGSTPNLTLPSFIFHSHHLPSRSSSLVFLPQSPFHCFLFLSLLTLALFLFSLSVFIVVLSSLSPLGCFLSLCSSLFDCPFRYCFCGRGFVFLSMPSLRLFFSWCWLFLSFSSACLSLVQIYNFWDKDSKQRLKQSLKCPLPIVSCAFNTEGNMFACTLPLFCFSHFFLLCRFSSLLTCASSLSCCSSQFFCSLFFGFHDRTFSLLHLSSWLSFCFIVSFIAIFSCVLSGFPVSRTRCVFV